MISISDVQGVCTLAAPGTSPSSVVDGIDDELLDRSGCWLRE
jgi:hypothetical protein